MRHLAGDDFEVYSAGTKPAHSGLSENAIIAMSEIDIDISHHRSKSLNEIPLGEMDYIVTMGCGVQCPYIPGIKIIAWEIPDPYGEGIERFREVREIIRERVEELLEVLREESK